MGQFGYSLTSFCNMTADQHVDSCYWKDLRGQERPLSELLQPGSIQESLSWQSAVFQARVWFPPLAKPLLVFLKVTLTLCYSSSSPPGGQGRGVPTPANLTSSFTQLPGCTLFPTHLGTSFLNLNALYLEIKKTEHLLFLVLFVPFITFLLLGAV